MGCICSKSSSDDKEKVDEYEKEKEKESSNKSSSVQVVAPAVSTAQLDGSTNGSGPRMAKSSSQVIREFVKDNKSNKNHLDAATRSQHQRCNTMSGGVGERKPLMSRILSVQHFAGEQHVDSGWPLWLSSVAAEAIKGWMPRRADSFEKLDQIGQGAYSSVHKARDLETGKIVALKKVRFSSTEAESVKFMAREIYILRQLDHPNVIKLEGIVTSRTSTSLYLVFEYMEHDLAGLATIHGFKLTEPQIKCYMQQLLRGLEHCHSRGVLHRDIKGSNLLIDNNGNLKIGDFGLSIVCDPDKKQPLTSRVVTLWYRAPELLLGATDYGAAIDMWSVGCILAELLVGKPIMPGRTEVEQMHKIFKLCGSPSEDYWQRTKLPHATSFKPQHPYNRQVSETFKNFSPTASALVDMLLTIEPEDRGSATSALESQFFTTNPLPCNPSSLPKFSPTKEFDSKRREKEATRKNAESIKGRGPASVYRGAADTKVMGSPKYIARGDISMRGKSNTRMSHVKHQSEEDGESNDNGEATMISLHNAYTQMQSSMAGPSSLRKNSELPTHHAAAEFSTSSVKKEPGMSVREPGVGYMPKKNRIHCSGPLGSNIDDMLKEHERLMQDVFRSLGRVVDRGLRESRAIDTESLCVLSGKLVWAIRVDIHILDNAGNLVDAANIAALASLLTFRRPECSLAGEDGQDVVVHPPEERDPIPLIIHHLPIAVTFGFFSNENLLVIDPTHHEECVMTGRMTATLNSNGDVCAIQKPGGESVSHSVIMHCLKLAHVKATDITTKIRDAVEIHNNERALRKIKRHSSSVAVDVCGEKQNQLDASHLDKLKLEEEEESPMECEASPSGQEQSKDGVSKNFTGGPSSWDPYSECVNSDLLKASLASRGPSVPSKQKDSRRETKPKEPPLEIKTDSTPINKALTAGQNNKGKTLKDAVKPKHKKKKIVSSNNEN
ncbi:Putative serine/threonine-protein kinase [Glycine soja]|nr:Putative serine/threonine-protein kinase [Glycine soja]